MARLSTPRGCTRSSALAAPPSPLGGEDTQWQRHRGSHEPDADEESYVLGLWDPALRGDATPAKPTRVRAGGFTDETQLFEQDIESYVVAMVVDMIPEGAAAGDTTLAAGARSTASAGSTRRALTSTEQSVSDTHERSLYSPEEEARRERNRLKVRRMYYRKLVRLRLVTAALCDLTHARIFLCAACSQERLASLRAEMAQYEATLQSILAARGSRVCHQCAHSPSASRDLIMARMAKLERVIKTLERENDTLRRILFQHEQEFNRIQRSLQRLQQVTVAPLPGSIKIKQLSHAECIELRNRSLDDLRAFDRTKNVFTNGGKVCGWDNLQLVQDNMLKFYVEKHIANFRADQMAALSWSVVRNPERFASLYSDAVGMKCRTLQRIDDDNIVRVHEHSTMNSNNERVTVKTIILLSRFQTAHGYLILVRSLDHAAMVVEDSSLDECLGRVVWNDLFCWYISLSLSLSPFVLHTFSTNGFLFACARGRLEYTPDTSGLSCTFAGLASMVVDANAYAWMIELMQVAVRWEAMTIGPARLLPSQD
ncbi:hypothetical protein FI667_g14721, partial [Globisporangium splendens]